MFIGYVNVPKGDIKEPIGTFLLFWPLLYGITFFKITPMNRQPSFICQNTDREDKPASKGRKDEKKIHGISAIACIGLGSN